MALMDVRAEHSPSGVARVEVDLGDGHRLRVRAQRDGDYVSVDVRWQVPALATGPPVEVRGRKTERLLGARLDKREGNAVLAPVG